MNYDRKPTAYGAKPPAQETHAPVREPVAEQEPAVDVVAVENYLRANPQAGDLEQYPRDAFAGIGRRLFAFMLDCLIVMPTMLIAAWMFGTFPGQHQADAESVGLFGLSPQIAKLVSKVLQLLLYDTYFTACLFRWGGTWGMKFSGIGVLRRDLATPSKGQARGRYWATILSMLPLGLGLLAIGWDRHRRAWHDRLVGTYVVLTRKMPAQVIHVRRRATSAKDESAKDAKNIETALMLFILITFAPGLIVLGLARLLLGKVGIIKGKPKAVEATGVQPGAKPSERPKSAA
jgi:uncharacterized RDD family membrane protein YckC